MPTKQRTARAKGRTKDRHVLSAEEPEAYEAAWYPSPIKFPERTLGRAQIRHRIIPKGGEVIIVGHRQALLRDTNPVRGFATEDLRIHELLESRKGLEDGIKSLWMTDLPEELNQIHEMLHTVKPQGRVLVGGLGLGILTRLVAQLPGVEHVTVVEQSKDIIKLCAPDGGARRCITTEHDDIIHYLQHTKERFDYYLLDTWAGTNEGTWWADVLPLRRIIRQRWGIKPEIHCWAEDIMWGQVRRGLTHHQIPHWYYSYLPVPMSEADADAFLNMAGSKWWEKKYGGAVDRYVNEGSKREVL